MSWNDIMRRVLPPVWDENRKAYIPPNITSPYGATDRPKGSSNPHGGVDFNYFGGRDSRFNKSNPAIRSPVSGVIENAGQGDYGTITIRDANGFLHQILHTHSRHVAVGDPVVAGQLIGTMGNMGVKAPGVEYGDPHVHYQLKDPAGARVNPTEFWDQQGPIDSNPAPPAYLDDYQRYLATPGAAIGAPSANGPNAGQLYGSQAVGPAAATTAARKKMRVLSGKYNPPRPDLGGYDANAPATVPNQIPPSDQPPSFEERFGNWVSSPAGTAPLGPYQPVAPPPQPARPPGIVAGQPKPDIPLPPWAFGLPDPRERPDDPAWFLGSLAGPGWKR